MPRMLYEIILPLFAGHIFSDFIFQTEDDVKQKSRIIILFKHSLIVGFVSYVLFGIYQAWHVGLAIFILHALIDFFKSKRREDSIKVFILDQCAHLAVIIIISTIIWSQGLYPMQVIWLQLMGHWYYPTLLVLTGGIICIFVNGYIVGLLVKPLLEQIETSHQGKLDRSSDLSAIHARGLKDGGRIIGHLERALIYIFILVNQPEAIGFLIAAKSVFRFGEIRDKSNRMEAEYIIIGTLYSFLFGLIVSYTIQRLLYIIN